MTTPYETTDFATNGQWTVVDYRITGTRSVPNFKEVFTDLGHGGFSQQDVEDGEKQIIEDVEIVDWCYIDGSPFDWTEEDKRAFISWLNCKGE